MGQIKDLSVSFISLVSAPATGKGLTLKSAPEGTRPQVFELVKTNEELMVAYGVVYAPDQVDAHGDQADAKAIRRAAYEFMREGRLNNIDMEHSFTTEMAFVAESWIVKANDGMFPDEPEGAWVVGIRVGDPDIWAKLKSGELTGLSLAGIATMEPEPKDGPTTEYTEKDAAPGWFKNWLEKTGLVTPEKPTEENAEMDKKEVQDIVRDTLKSELGDAIKDALKTIGDPASTGDPAPSGDADPKGSGQASAGETDVEKAIAKAFEGLETKLDDKITKALAKGAVETDPAQGETEESFV